MSKISSLYELIKHLSSAEKRAVSTKLLDKTLGNTARLYNYCLKAKSIEDLTLKIESDHQLVSLKRAAFLNHSYSLLLAVLVDVDKESPKHRAWKFLQEVEFLFKKGLIAQSNTELKKAKKFYIKFGLEHHHLMLLDLERRILRRQISSRTSKELSGKAEEAKLIFENLQIQERILAYYDQVYVPIHLGQATVPNPEIVQFIDETEKEPNLSLESRIRLKILEYSFYDKAFEKDLIRSSTFLEEILSIYQGNTVLFKSNPARYITCLKSYFNICISIRQFDKFNEQLAGFDGNVHLPREDYRALLALKQYSSLLFQIRSRKFDGLYGFIGETNTVLTDNNIPLSDRVSFYLNFAILCVYLNKHEEALDWVLEVNNNVTLEKGRYGLESKIIEIIVHFELSNFEYISYILTSLRRYLLKNKRLGPFERLFIKDMNKIVNAVDRRSRLSLLRELSQQLTALPEHSVFHDEVLYWIDQKLK